MSTYNNGRRAPNVSQYLQNLNTIPTPQDVSAQSDFNLPDDLDFLTNTEFFDFDNFNGNVADFPAPQGPRATRPDAARKPAEVNTTGPQYQFGEFQTYPSTMTASPSSLAPSPPGLQGQYPPQPHHFGSSSVSAGDKRTASVAGIAQPGDLLEDGSRMAAEEDKRRRNTAASARFRVKKKQREQALEKQAKEMSDKVAQLEGKVQQLETENKWLKNLLTEKSDPTKLGELTGPSSKKADKEAEERSTGSRTDGVGTVDVESEA